MIATLCGGVGAARMLSGLVQVVDPATVTAVVNTGDDLVLHGLHISPDIDTVLYTLGGLDNKVTGWGVATESWTVMQELEVLGGEHWFRLGDRDLATHLYRTQRLGEGATLSAVTAELADARGVGVTILPMSDDPVRTRLTLAEPVPGASAGEEIAFQDYFVRLRHDVAVSALRFDGIDTARPGPGVLDALSGADLVIACPSNPLVSLGPILSIPGVRELLASRRTRVVAVSPLVAGVALKGPADRMMAELGHEVSVTGIARLYAEWAGTLVIDEQDGELAEAVQQAGMRAVVAPTVMSSQERSAALARVVLHAAG